MILNVKNILGENYSDKEGFVKREKIDLILSELESTTDTTITLDLSEFKLRDRAVNNIN